MSQPQSESAIVARILLALTKHCSGVCVAWRQNTGAVRMPGGPRGVRDRFVRFGRPGAADITGILADGRRLEIEVKTASGKPSPEQFRFQEQIEAMGGVYILARSDEEAVAGVLQAMNRRPADSRQYGLVMCRDGRRSPPWRGLGIAEVGGVTP